MLPHVRPHRGILAIAFFFLLSVAGPVAAHVDTRPDVTSVVQKADTVRVAKRRRRVKRKNRSKPAAPRTDAPPTGDPAATAPPPAAAPDEAPAGPDNAGVLPGRRQGPSRIDFDERMIKGQTNKANAIYLFERRSSGMTLVQKRGHFHEEIDDTLR